MPVINTDAARRADAILQEDLVDWRLAQNISLKDKHGWRASLEELMLKTDDPEYCKLISARARICYDNRLAKLNKSLDASTTSLKKQFSKGPGRKYKRPSSKSTTAGAVASIINSLSEGVSS